MKEENGGGETVREVDAAAPAPVAPRAGAPPRPTITLPPRFTLESLFHGGGGGAGASEVSPGPLTLVSSFFADDPESECRSFTQLLVGAMNSPVPAARRTVGSAGEQGKEVEKRSSGGELESGGGLVRLGQNRPPILLAFPCSPLLSSRAHSPRPLPPSFFLSLPY
ncbi:hypothetical protein C4D60_Mb07t01050 [Musa balbisiana]|uniref:Uncharacterized protein n=1 Tax=Musa balbisiana TaxID=52838 RepID=A0A4S8JC31_MUSBA|nr:hypothetical protein C4D60_Mb07t01050 [Musa balbisiana]